MITPFFLGAALKLPKTRQSVTTVTKIRFTNDTKMTSVTE